MVLVLQVYWEDGVPYRVKIAEINEQECKAASPAWKLIALM